MRRRRPLKAPCAAPEAMPTSFPTWRIRALSAAAAALLALATTATALAQPAARRGAEDASHPCGLIFTNHHGPLDYRTQRSSIKIVEDFHFKPYMEAGLRGDNAPVGGEINYTLKASPNHHRALVALNRVVDRARADRVPGMEWPMDCYYDRAVRFAPDDPIVRMLFAQFLHRRNKTADALRQLERARELADNPLTSQNVGLVYLEFGRIEEAQRQLRRAEELGVDPAGSFLAAALRRAGHQPLPAQPPAATASGVEAAPVAPSAPSASSPTPS